MSWLTRAAGGIRNCDTKFQLNLAATLIRGENLAPVGCGCVLKTVWERKMQWAEKGNGDREACRFSMIQRNRGAKKSPRPCHSVSSCMTDVFTSPYLPDCLGLGYRFAGVSLRTWKIFCTVFKHPWWLPRSVIPMQFLSFWEDLVFALWKLSGFPLCFGILKPYYNVSRCVSFQLLYLALNGPINLKNMSFLDLVTSIYSFLLELPWEGSRRFWVCSPWLPAALSQLFIPSGLCSYRACSSQSLTLSLSVSVLCVVQLFKFAIIKINLNDRVFISKTFDYFYKNLFSFHDCDFLTSPLRIEIMLQKALCSSQSPCILSCYTEDIQFICPSAGFLHQCLMPYFLAPTNFISFTFKDSSQFLILMVLFISWHYEDSLSF